MEIAVINQNKIKFINQPAGIIKAIIIRISYTTCQQQAEGEYPKQINNPD